MFVKLYVLCLFCPVFITSQRFYKAVTVQNLAIFYYDTDYNFYNVTVPSSRQLSEHLNNNSARLCKISYPHPIIYRNFLNNVTSLEVLELIDNQIEAINPGALKNVRNLQFLYLDNNYLNNIKSGVFNNLNIAELRLSKNFISSISHGAFDNMHKLTYIDLSHNQLNYWDSFWFKDTPKLSILILSNNQIAKIPENGFDNFKNREQNVKVWLHLDNNRITYISHNVFGATKELGGLSLENNGIGIWDESFLDNVTINELNLSCNRMTCLFGKLSRIFVANHTYISGNPWNIQCLQAIQEWSRVHLDFESSFVKIHVKKSDIMCNTVEEGILM